MFVTKKTISTLLNKRKFSYVYYLPLNDGNRQKVCKTMFLNTLGLKSDSKITSFLKSIITNFGIINFITQGKYIRQNFLTIREQIIAHIKSYNPQVTDYTYNHAPFRKYLDCTLSITKMYNDFK